MKTIKLEKDILVYQFEPEENRILGNNILMIINGDECLVIDTGYPRHFKKVLEDINKRNLKITHVILSHFHPDHIGGFPSIHEAVIYGSIYAEKTLQLFGEDYQTCKPNVLVHGNMSIEFGDHKIDMELNPGHSIDGLLTIIDNLYMFVGDDIMFDNFGNSVIPFLAEHNFEQHILSVTKILELHKNKIIIPGHGKIIEDSDFFRSELNKRLSYLNFFVKNKEASYNDFFKSTRINFLSEKWHNYNKVKD